MAWIPKNGTRIPLAGSLPLGRVLRPRQRSDMEMKGNGDTFATVASDFYVHTKYVSVTTLEFTLAHTVPGVGFRHNPTPGTTILAHRSTARYPTAMGPLPTPR